MSIDGMITLDWFTIKQLQQKDGMPPSTRYQAIKEGRHPKGTKFGRRSRKWHRDEMADYYDKLRSQSGRA